MRRERHGLPPLRAIDTVVLPAEGHVFVVGGDQAPIGDGDAMRIAREIAQHLLGTRERVLAVIHPFAVPQRGQEPLDGSLIGKPRKRAEKLQAPSLCAFFSICRNLPRNRRASTFMCTRKLARDEIHLLR